MNRNDWILFWSAIALAVIIFISFWFTGMSEDGQVVVRVDGEIEAVYSLNEEQTVDILDGKNHIRISNRSVDMIDATCPDQLCVHQRAISKNRESIICLPNKVIVQIENQEEAGLDALTN